MSVLSVLLYPFAVMFRIATGLRNHLYDIGHKQSTSFEVPVISVGNLNLGGSGKTPTIEYLIRLLKKDYNIATLSRGYGRRTKGLRFAGSKDSATSIGDEPFQFYRKFGHEVKVVVGEDRAFAIPNILHKHQDTNVILLDDAFQHRSVRPHLNILLTNFEKPFYKDFLLPMGRLRESRKESSRADIIIVTKCNEDLDDATQERMKDEVFAYSGSKPLFFTYISYGSPKPFHNTEDLITSKVVLLTGIAKPDPLEEYVSANFEIVRHFRFQDHHSYSIDEINEIKEFVKGYQEELSILTTEKDMVRLLDEKFRDSLLSVKCFFIPIEMDFIKNGAEFDKQVHQAIEMVIDKPNPSGLNYI